jgi:predicted DNA-binding transcriptional regulator AlpA
MEDLKHNSKLSGSTERRATPLLTAKDVAAELSVSEAWVRDHATGRRLPALPVVRLGGRKAVLRFRREDLDRFLQFHSRNSNTGGL